VVLQNDERKGCVCNLPPILREKGVSQGEGRMWKTEICSMKTLREKGDLKSKSARWNLVKRGMTLREI